MKNDKILGMFERSKALLNGHFALSSGLHSAKYLQCALLLSYPGYTEEICRKLASKLEKQGIDTVIGPAYGGIILAYELARALGVRAIFSERKDGMMQLRRNFTISKGENVLIAEDVVTTGKSVKEVIDTIKPFNPRIVGIAGIVDRSGKEKPFGDIPYTSLLKMDIETYRPEECPLCKEGIPLVKPGSRQKA